MFSLIWRFFPGPGWLRALVILVVLALLVWALMIYVYPLVATLIPSPVSEVGLGLSGGEVSGGAVSGSGLKGSYGV
ncbi:hypothetical protein [Leucobacter sp. OH1287]|uniref:hypothetical protein n=1 Tax=Leucobacter sp. OH1287 TaxID=2491049 RepID=UPI000F5EAD11|nr:hypothetical protein [Leucobacter sp. OH1287]RRD60334.1 hypothetical protein EII30_06140 [Leucobacter sp. OH1287]